MEEKSKISINIEVTSQMGCAKVDGEESSPELIDNSIKVLENTIDRLKGIKNKHKERSRDFSDESDDEETLEIGEVGIPSHIEKYLDADMKKKYKEDERFREFVKKSIEFIDNLSKDINGRK